MYGSQPTSYERGSLTLPSTACMLFKYDFGGRSCSMTIQGMYDAGDEEGTRIAPMTGHTPLQYGNAFWNDLL